MDPEVVALGKRIRESMPRGMSQKVLAEKIAMPADALSRIFSGHRGISALELARIAEQIGADTHFLLTGEPDPHRYAVAARHEWDKDSKRHVHPGGEADDSLLELIRGAYAAAFPDGPAPSAPLPETGAKAREALDTGFVFTFAENVEKHLDVDVIRIPRLKTDYSLTIGERGIVVLSAESTWFRSNWSLAHELGHLASKHHEGESSEKLATRKNWDSEEAAANAFAAELLLPATEIDTVHWPSANERQVADFLWQTGISTKALATRLDVLHVARSPAVEGMLKTTTTRLLKKFGGDLPSGGKIDAEIALRRQVASTRRFPLTLITALEERTSAGLADPRHLAWVLDVEVDELDFPEFSGEPSSAALAAMSPPPPGTLVVS